jgi:hypothetical protein
MQNFAFSTRFGMIALRCKSDQESGKSHPNNIQLFYYYSCVLTLFALSHVGFTSSPSDLFVLTVRADLLDTLTYIDLIFGIVL